MDRTPSPPRHGACTPPAPLHGSKYDRYDPYSPRRSSRRVAQNQPEVDSPAHSRISRAMTPPSSRKRVVRTFNLALSPPSSPSSPAKHPSPRSTRRNHLETGPVDSDSDHVAQMPARRLAADLEAARGMLPTPAKTPRKRALHSEASLSSTARVLFPARPATVEDAMPTPRKGRRNIKNVFTLESFAEQTEEDAEKIEIYTDSKERVPTGDEEGDNPFVAKKGKGKAKAISAKPRKVYNPETASLNDAASRGEGMIYMFRGKKVFRKFDDAPPPSDSDEGPALSDNEVRRQAGHVAHRPITRSLIKPRLLFQEEIQQRRQQAAQDEVDEEAITDIEVTVATPSKKTRRGGPSVVQGSTPPPTTSRPKREISFDSWTRVKTSAPNSNSSREGKKRGGDPLESTVDKRMRTVR